MRQDRSLSRAARNVLFQWFVLYNPLYFFSALCVLGGVFLISVSLPEAHEQVGRLALAGVVQAYEFLLLGCAAFLFRYAGLRRPAVILGIVWIPFLFDWTFQTEALSVSWKYGMYASAAWAALVPVKLCLAGWAFRLRIRPRVLAVPTLAAAAVAFAPHLLMSRQVDPQLAHLASVWLGVLLVMVTLHMRPRISGGSEHDGWARVVLRRVLKTAAWVWAGLYFVHVGEWITLCHVRPDLSHAAPLLMLLPFLARNELLSWAGAAGAVGLSLLCPHTVTANAAIVGLVLGWLVRDGYERRLLVGAVLCLHFSVWTFGWQAFPLPEPLLWLNVATASALLLMAWRLRMLTPLPAAALVLYPNADAIAPQGMLQWGIAAVAVGFVALLLGVAANWRLRRATDP